MSATLAWEDLPDATNHLVRILVVDAALRQEWYPRWLSDLYLGYGYPLLNYYAPGPYFLGAALHRLGFSIYQSLQLAGLLGVAGGASGAFWFARSLYRRSDAGLLAAAAYALAPYPFFTNLYVRGDVPEVLALGLLPWLLGAAWGAWQGSRRWSVALTVITAALVLTHNVTALFGVALLGCWMGVLTLVAPPSTLLASSLSSPKSEVRGPKPPNVRVPPWHRRRSGHGAAAMRVALAAAIGIGLAAFFWLPALVEQGQVRLSLGQEGIFDFHRWLFDPLAAGGGTALAAYPHTRIGPADLGLRFSYDALNLHAPEKISVPQLALWAAGTAGALSLATTLAGTAGRTARRLALVWSAFAAALWFLNTTWSAWLWEHLPLLPAVQFPWRLYGPLALCIALAASGGWACVATALDTASERRGLKPPATSAKGAEAPWQGPATVQPASAGFVRLRRIAGAFMPRRPRRPELPALPAGYVLAFGAATLMAVNAAVALRPHRTAPPPAHDVDARTLVAEEYNRFAAGTTSGGEFLPKEVDWPRYATGVWQGIEVYDQAFPEPGWQAGLVRVLDGRAAIADVVRAPAAITVQVDAETPVQLGFHQLLFAGWRAQIDGRAAPIAPATYEWTAPDPPHELVRGTLGFMVLNVPAGAHRVEVSFGSTPARTLGQAISTAALAFALAWCAWRLLWGQAALGRPGRAAKPLRAPAPALAALTLVGLVACGTTWVMRPDGVSSRAPRDTHRVALDIAGTVRNGADSTALGTAPSSPGLVTTTTPAGVGRGLAPPFLDLSYLRLGGEERRWLYMHPPSSVTVSLRVPPDAYFQSGLGLNPQTWDTPLGDGVRFIVEVDGPAGRVRLLDRHVNPRARTEERRWLDVWVSLEPFAGQSIRLTLRTDQADDPSFDWAGWANPQIVLWPGLRPNPGEGHKF